MSNIIALAQPFDATFKVIDDGGRPCWRPCQVVGLKDGGLSHSFLIISADDSGMLFPFEVGEVRPLRDDAL